jgi:hypothetical protein
MLHRLGGKTKNPDLPYLPRASRDPTCIKWEKGGGVCIAVRLGKDAFKEMCVTGRSATTIVRDKWLVQISDERERQLSLTKLSRKTPIRSINTEKARSGYLDFCRPGDEKDKGTGKPALVNEILK